MTTLFTLNATVDEIADALKAGKSVQDVAADLAEPPNNVYGVYRDLVARGVIEDGKRPGRPAQALRPVPVETPAARVTPVARAAGHEPPASVTPVAGAGAQPLSVDALVAAAARSSSRRTKALGVRLHDLATVVRERLADEREAAEKAEAQRVERERARAEVERLEKQLREAREKAGMKSGRYSVSRKGAGNPNPAPNAKKGEYPCRVGCDRTFTYPGPRGNHEKKCKGGTS